jgi:hypothetical protein
MSSSHAALHPATGRAEEGHVAMKEYKKRRRSTAGASGGKKPPWRRPPTFSPRRWRRRSGRRVAAGTTPGDDRDCLVALNEQLDRLYVNDTGCRCAQGELLQMSDDNDNPAGRADLSAEDQDYNPAVEPRRPRAQLAA